MVAVPIFIFLSLFLYLTLLDDLKINDMEYSDVLNVGIGNGYADFEIFKDIESFRAVDISAAALDYAKKKLPNMVSYEGSAEDLNKISINSIDLYLSFRTFQSTLFDRRAAVHEAYRVLRNGGNIIISIPAMFLKENGDVLPGLIPPGSAEPNMEYANEIVKRIKEYMEILNFQQVRSDNRSPFEIYIFGKR